MPSIKTITPILGDHYYHIFNRGTQGKQVFFSSKNYQYFLALFNQYMSPCVSLLAFSLLPNHFHFLIKTVSELPPNQKVNKKLELSDSKRKPSNVCFQNKEEEFVGKFVSNQFRRFFITYTMAINKQENTTGNLFDRTFKRLEINDEDYLRYLAFYIHYNPQKHEIVNNFRDYRFSSWKAYQSAKPSKLNRNLLLQFYGGFDEFTAYHSYLHEEKEDIIIE